MYQRIFAVVTIVFFALAWASCGGQDIDVGNSNSGTNSGNSGSNAGNSSSNTGNSGTNSGNSGTNSGNSGTNTGNSGTNTGNSGTNTGNSGTNTGNSGTNTGNSGNNSEENSATQEARSEEIGDQCEEACALEVDCGSIDGTDEAECVDTCTDGAESILLGVGDGCYDAKIDALDCSTDLSCSEYSDYDTHCVDEYEAIGSACGFPGGTSGTPIPVPDPRVVTACEGECDVEDECFDGAEPDWATCSNNCVNKAYKSMEDNSLECFDAELDLKECSNDLSCSELDDFLDHCGDEFDAVGEICEFGG